MRAYGGLFEEREDADALEWFFLSELDKSGWKYFLAAHLPIQHYVNKALAFPFSVISQSHSKLNKQFSSVLIS